MVVSESQEKQLLAGSSVGRGTSQWARTHLSLSQSFEISQQLSSSRDILESNTGPREYAETDSLLPNELYSGSRLSQSTRGKDAGVSAAPAEPVCAMVMQILVPFVVAGLGTVCAGILLDVVQVRNPEKSALINVYDKVNKWLVSWCVDCDRTYM